LLGKVINLEYGYLENGNLKFYLKKNLGAPRTPGGEDVWHVCGVGDDYRECYDPIFEITVSRFEITVFEITVFEDKPSYQFALG